MVVVEDLEGGNSVAEVAIDMVVDVVVVEVSAVDEVVVMLSVIEADAETRMAVAGTGGIRMEAVAGGEILMEVVGEGALIHSGLEMWCCGVLLGLSCKIGA